MELEKVIPPLPRVVRGKPVVLGADPKGTYLLYASGNSVVLRNLKNPSENDMYTQHSGTVNVAKYSPSGFYIASADKFGKIRIWDTSNKEHILKNEFQPFSGAVCDLAWTSDNLRIIVGGTGQSQFGAVFHAETGSSVGVIMGMSKNINSVDFRPTRPYRAATGNDEGLVNYFEGPPFTFKHYFNHHSTFVNVVRFCPTGACFISTGSDGKIFIYDAENGSTVGELGNPAHKGGIYGACFSKDGSRFLSASADKSLKLWKVDGQQFTFLSQYEFENKPENIGWIYLFDADAHVTHLSAPRRVIAGHVSLITCAVYSPLYERLITASSDSSVASWDLSECSAEMFSGSQAHKAHVQAMALAADHLVTVGYDDRCVLSDIVNRKFITSVKLPSQPHCIGIEARRMLVAVGCDRHMVLLRVSNQSLSIVDQQEVDLGKCALTVSPTTGTVVVCGANEKFLAFKTCNDRLHTVPLVNPPAKRPVLGAYSDDGSMIALVDAERTVTVHSMTDEEDEHQLPTLKSICPEWWQRQTARVTAIGWSPNGRRIATGSLDTSIVIWSLDSPKHPIILCNAHPMSNSTSLSWMDDCNLASTALDGSIRCWKVSKS
ncbi:hypothetical protein AHF37_01537 [Paragonimus kellicotti]|nr:hypothetical protein AHF37_01537 [Paragonimus kellicotti]